MSRRIRKKRHRRKRTFFRVFSVSIFIFVILGLGIVYGYNILNKLDNVDIPTDDAGLGITNDAMEHKDVMNIALFGLDDASAQNGGRSDSIMIATLDKVHKKIKITSIMRDTYVDIPGHGMDKINHAHSFGGPELAIRTINQNFDMNIREFATVDFLGLKNIIDTIGGVEIDVKQNEVKYINMGVRYMNQFDDKKGKQITNSGLQTLTGKQAVSYARIRKTGDGDFERTQRQRLVLEQAIYKALHSGVTKYPALLDTALPFVTTSLSKKEILSLGTFVATSGIDQVDKYRIPLNKYLSEERKNGAAVLVPDTLDDNVRALRSYIYDDIKEDINDYNKDNSYNQNNNYN